MILPIVAYGDPVLRKTARPIAKDFQDLSALIENMWQTMYEASGVGLAAPQIGLPIRLFVVDASPFSESESLNEQEKEQLGKLKKVFINAKITVESGKEWAFSEGCLSIPNISEEVYRKSEIKIEYEDENFVKHQEQYSGIAARIIQHEYDHIEGVLFTDKLSSLKRGLLKRKLDKISKGQTEVAYKMKFPLAKKVG